MTDSRDTVTDPEIVELDEVFRAIADPKRRRLLDLLKDGPRTTGELVEAFPDVTRYAVMKHLNVLQSADLIIVRYDGSLRYNTLNPVPLQAIHDRWVLGFAAMWAPSLSNLKNDLERGGDNPAEASP